MAVAASFAAGSARVSSFSDSAPAVRVLKIAHRPCGVQEGRKRAAASTAQEARATYHVIPHNQWPLAQILPTRDDTSVAGAKAFEPQPSRGRLLILPPKPQPAGRGVSVGS